MTVHETKLCLSLLALASEHLERSGGSRIVALRVRVGELSGVVPEALASAFPICAERTAAAGAELTLEPVPGRELELQEMEVI